MKKYELTSESKLWFGRTLFRIKALVSFGDIKTGELGGFVEKEENLEQYGDAWVSGDARVSGNAQVSGDARVLSRKHVACFSNVGSEDGTLTAYTTKQNGIEITRGCFRGSLEEFEAAVAKHHGESYFGKQYVALVQYIKLRFLGVTVELEVEAAIDEVPEADAATETEADDAT